LINRAVTMPAIDFDLHGLVGIRLLDPTMSEAAAVGRQLGLSPGTLARDPDIVIRWMDGMATSRLRLIGDHEAGHDNDSFYLLRGKHQARCRVKIPFEHIGCVGRTTEIVCESGIQGVPLLVPIVNFTLLAKGIVPVHASAFVYRGQGVLAAGWSKGGKTESLLSFVDRGAEYIADDWAYITPRGELYGMAEPIRLRAWHVHELPRLRRRLPLAARTRLRTLDLADCWKDALPRRSRLLPSRSVARLLHLLARQAYVTVPPRQLFDRMAQPPAKFDQLFLLASHECSEVRIQPADPVEIARKMLFSVQEERERFLTYYRKFRFAFPNRANPLIDDCERLQHELLVKAFAGKPAHTVLHPYPVRIPSLFDAMQHLVETGESRPETNSATMQPLSPNSDRPRRLATVET
jgi:hypothetical protein